jgi:hypothetical protein
VISAEPLTVYHFSGELRKPTVKIAARDVFGACLYYMRKMGLASSHIVRPRGEVPFDPLLHRNVEIADHDEAALLDYPDEAFHPKYKGSRSKYGDGDPDSYPLLQHFGRGSISPEWVIDRRSGEVRIAGEFESFPKYFLDLSKKPARDALLAKGGRENAGGGFDLLARDLNAEFPWLMIEDGEDLKNRLLDEIDRYEREHS